MLLVLDSRPSRSVLQPYSCALASKAGKTSSRPTGAVSCTSHHSVSSPRNGGTSGAGSVAARVEAQPASRFTNSHAQTARARVTELEEPRSVQRLQRVLHRMRSVSRAVVQMSRRALVEGRSTRLLNGVTLAASAPRLASPPHASGEHRAERGIRLILRRHAPRNSWCVTRARSLRAKGM